MTREQKLEKIKRQLGATYWWDDVPKEGQELIELAVDLAYSQGTIDEGDKALKIMKKL